LIPPILFSTLGGEPEQRTDDPPNIILLEGLSADEDHTSVMDPTR
jgi:hypothetical protein